MQIKKTASVFDPQTAPATAEIIHALNGQQIKRVAHSGTSDWYSYPHGEAIFLVASGEVAIEFREEIVLLKIGESIMIPQQTEYRLATGTSVILLIFEAQFAPSWRVSPYKTPVYLW